jgi:hypothetical protein
MEIWTNLERFGKLQFSENKIHFFAKTKMPHEAVLGQL